MNSKHHPERPETAPDELTEDEKKLVEEIDQEAETVPKRKSLTLPLIMGY